MPLAPVVRGSWEKATSRSGYDDIVDHDDDDDDDMPPLPVTQTTLPSHTDDEEDEDDDMPPVVAAPRQGLQADAVASSLQQQGEDAVGSSDDDDDMPPLTAVQANGLPSMEVAREGHAKDEEDDGEDDMPPMLAAAHRSEHATLQNGDDADSSEDDDMPPLAAAQTTLSSNADALRQPSINGTAGHQEVEEDDDHDMPPLTAVQANALPSMEVAREGHAEDEEDDGEDDMPPMLAAAHRHEHATLQNGDDADSSEDDDMPPLAAAQTTLSSDADALRQPSINGTAGHQEVEEDEATNDASDCGSAQRPLLRSAEGKKEEAGAVPVQSADDSAEDSDDMPPLGPPKMATSMAGHHPMDGLGADHGTHQSKRRRSEDSNSKGPSLDGFRVGDDVILVGLANVSLNHERGKVIAQETATGKFKVQLDITQSTLSVKPGNLKLAEPEAATDFADQEQTKEGLEDDSDQSLASDDSMPPLAAVPGGEEQKTPVPPRDRNFQPGDRVRIRGLPHAKQIEGQLARVAPASASVISASRGRISVELEETGLTVSVKQENLELAAEDEAPDEPEPPEAGKGSGTQPGENEDDSDDSLPPLEFIKSKQLEDLYFSDDDEAPGGRHATKYGAVNDELLLGDLVELFNLKTRGLNGERGHVTRLPVSAGQKDRRVEIKLLSSGKVLSVKKANVRLPKDEEHAARTLRKKRKALCKGDTVFLKGLSAIEYNGQRAKVLAAPQSVNDRVTVQLLKTGSKMSLRQDKLERLDSDSSSEDLPPLLSSKPAPKDKRTKKSLKAPDPETSRESRAATGCDASDDDMPPLEVIRSRPKAEKPTKLEEPRGRFQIGQKLYLHWAQKPELHGLAVFVLPSDPRKVMADQVTIQLPTGKRVVIKDKYLKETPVPPKKPRSRPVRAKMSHQQAGTKEC